MDEGMKLREIAGAFVKLAHGGYLECGESQDLLKLVLAAGFTAASVTITKEETYLQPYGYHGHTVFAQVKNENGTLAPVASIWLNALRTKMNKIGEEERTPLVMTEVERSIPLTQIKLDGYSNVLKEYTFGLGVGLIDHVRDPDVIGKIGGVAGVHQNCGGLIKRAHDTSTHGVLVCNHCHLQIYFPVDIKTYGELRDHFRHLRMML
jgi:hypothetical protein